MENTSDSTVFRTRSTNEKIAKRIAAVADLVAIEKLGQTVDFHIGMHNIQLYFSTSPNTWYVACNESGELIAYDTYNKFSDNIRFAFQLLIRPDYRGQGITKQLNSVHYARCAFVGNATKDSLLRFGFEKFGVKLLGFIGRITKDIRTWIENQLHIIANPGIALEKVYISNISNVIQYDFSVLGYDRSEFLSEWILAKNYPCKSFGVLAKCQNGKTCGFGVLRQYDGYFALSPLYADNESIARHLLYALTLLMPDMEKLYVYFPAKNRLIYEFVHKWKFAFCDCELRHYTCVPEPHNWDMSKVYALHDFYPV